MHPHFTEKFQETFPLLLNHPLHSALLASMMGHPPFSVILLSGQLQQGLCVESPWLQVTLRGLQMAQNCRHWTGQARACDPRS